MLQTRIDHNVEVVTCLLNLTERGSLDWNTGISSQPYCREVMQHCSHLKKHPAVLLTNQLHAQGFWWDAMIELAVTCTVFPEAAHRRRWQFSLSQIRRRARKRSTNCSI
jgi:hypothetical protein